MTDTVRFVHNAPALSGPPFVSVDTRGSDYNVVAIRVAEGGQFVSLGCHNDTETSESYEQVERSLVSGTSHYVQVGRFVRSTNGNLVVSLK